MDISQEADQPQEPDSQTSEQLGPFAQTAMKNPDVTGHAIVVRDGTQETFILKTGFLSDTRFDDPKKASLEFQITGGENQNGRRIELTLDATRAGTHFVDGKRVEETWMGSSPLPIGEDTPNGTMAKLVYIADGGQVFFPKESCTIVIASPYTGRPDGSFAGEVKDCTVHSAGIDHHLSSVTFEMRGVPSH
jgi:hypothetical protein